MPLRPPLGASATQIRQHISYLIAENVRVIITEAISDYWKPFYFLMEEEQLPVILVLNEHATSLAGKPTSYFSSLR